MAKLTLEDLYYGEKYDIMGKVVVELLRGGKRENEQTQIELCIVKHTLLAAQRMALDGDVIAEIE